MLGLANWNAPTFASGIRSCIPEACLRPSCHAPLLLDALACNLLTAEAERLFKPQQVLNGLFRLWSLPSLSVLSYLCLVLFRQRVAARLVNART